MLTKLSVATIITVSVMMLLVVGNQSFSAGEVLDTGKFVTIDPDHETKGKVEVLKKDGRAYVRLAEDFSTAEGPDVKLLLHKMHPPEGFDKGDYINLGELKSLSGAQEYAVPDGVDLNEYKSVVVWCGKFNIVFGAAHLQDT